jgi:ketopantoate reductase
MAHHVSAKGIVGLGALGQALASLLPAPETSEPAAILFAVKAFDIKQALVEQSSHWPESIPFVTLCNGFIANEITAAQPRLGKRPIRIGMTTIGSTINTDQTITVFKSNTTTAWGPWDLSNQTVPAAGELQLLKRFPNGHWQDDMRPLICRKWILNVALNSLCAAQGLEHNSRLREFRAAAEDLITEAHELAQKLWPGLTDLPTRDEASQNLWQVVDATAGNENSMARDRRLGRRTESDFLAGIAKDFDGFHKLKSIHAQITAGGVRHT